MSMVAAASLCGSVFSLMFPFYIYDWEIEMIVNDLCWCSQKLIVSATLDAVLL